MHKYSVISNEQNLNTNEKLNILFDSEHKIRLTLTTTKREYKIHLSGCEVLLL